MNNVIARRIDADLRAPDFTKIEPPLDAGEYRIDCRDFESRQALEAEIRRRFSEKGLVLLTDTGLDGVGQLGDWGNILIDEPMAYGGAAPRSPLAKNIDDVVASQPAHLYLLYHNELAYLSLFPKCLVFGCETNCARGGETFIADNQAVTREILQTEIGRKLKKNGIRHIRNLTDASRSNDIVYKHWQDAFGVSSRTELGAIAEREGWDLEWKDNGGVRISYWVDPYEYNETLKENLLFITMNSGNYFDDMPPFNTLPYEDRPFGFMHEDGEPFTGQEMEYLLKTFDNHCLPVFWKPGWIAMLDNERWSHARPPFTLQAGETRKLGLMMGQPKYRLGSRWDTSPV